MTSPVFAKRGYKNHYVELVQRRMRKELGDPSIADDGDFGPQTEDAVKLFQRSRYLEDDGLIGAFTDACLFEKSIEKLHKRPVHVHQGNANRCWAAATESWLTTRIGRRRVPQQDIVDLLVSERGARARDGGLIIPFGQGLWEGFFGLKPITIAASDFTAESCARRMAKFGPLMLGSRIPGITGHVRVMWGTRVKGGYPHIEVIDPIGTTGVSVTVAVIDIRSYTGGYVLWLPTGMPLLI
jgi:peptidoglycan hydrolase-like protein with peptidoglycan-binding domain